MGQGKLFYAIIKIGHAGDTTFLIDEIDKSLVLAFCLTGVHALP